MLREGVADIPGCTVEDNKFCVSVHFRNCAEAAYTDVQARQPLQTLSGLCPSSPPRRELKDLRQFVVLHRAAACMRQCLALLPKGRTASVHERMRISNRVAAEGQPTRSSARPAGGGGGCPAAAARAAAIPGEKSSGAAPRGAPPPPEGLGFRVSGGHRPRQHEVSFSKPSLGWLLCMQQQSSSPHCLSQTPACGAGR